MISCSAFAPTVGVSVPTPEIPQAKLKIEAREKLSELLKRLIDRNPFPVGLDFYVLFFNPYSFFLDFPSFFSMSATGSLLELGSGQPRSRDSREALRGRRLCFALENDPDGAFKSLLCQASNHPSRD